MCVVCTVSYSVAATTAVLGSTVIPVSDFSRPVQDIKNLSSLEELSEDFKAPDIKDPEWLVAMNTPATPADNGQSQRAPAQSRTISYSVSTRGNLKTSLGEFKQQVNQTLNDQRGWPRMGVSFQEVASGGSFIVVLSEASQVPSFAPGGCSAELSCRVGQYIIINQDRWLMPTSAWNATGASLRDYRHMVVNHEVGHWFGHGHVACTGAGQPAAVMQQQSTGMYGCTPNPWPLQRELVSSQIGVDTR